MTRDLAVFLPVRPERLVAIEDVLVGDPGVWLADARATRPDVWRTSLQVGPLRREIACRVGPVRDGPGAVWRDVSWNPVAQRGDPVPVHELLPHFAGELGLHRGRGVLVLSGRYAVPGGRLGELTDAVALSRVARATATRFLARISACASEHVPAAGA